MHFNTGTFVVGLIGAIAFKGNKAIGGIAVNNKTLYTTLVINPVRRIDQI